MFGVGPGASIHRPADYVSEASRFRAPLLNMFRPFGIAYLCQISRLLLPPLLSDQGRVRLTISPSRTVPAG